MCFLCVCAVFLSVSAWSSWDTLAMPKLSGGSGHGLRGSSTSPDEGGPYKPDTWDILLISDLDKKVTRKRGVVSILLVSCSGQAYWG